jgi:hypothetical protein
MFENIKKRFQKPQPKASAASTPKPKKSEKEIADKKGEPYVAILGMEVDPENLHQGSFELDWNEKFVSNLIRAGYQGDTDADIVDQWFQTVCRHVVMETYDQYDAMNHETYVHTRNLGDGRKEVS